MQEALVYFNYGAAGMKKLIVYYTWTGNTEAAAKALAAETGADIRVLKEKKERRKASGFLSAAFGALTGSKSALKDPDYNTEGYDIIFIGTPVWAAHSVPAINTWIHNAVFHDRAVYLFTTNASGKSKRSIDSLTGRITNKGGKVQGSFTIRAERNGKVDPQKVRSQIKAWVKSQKLG